MGRSRPRRAVQPDSRDGAYSCAEGADALVIVTEWEQFRALDLARLRRVMATAVMVDLRNVYQPDQVTKHGFRHVGVGRMPVGRARLALAFDNTSVEEASKQLLPEQEPVRTLRRDAEGD